MSDKEKAMHKALNAMYIKPDGTKRNQLEVISIANACMTASILACLGEDIPEPGELLRSSIPMKWPGHQIEVIVNLLKEGGDDVEA